MVTTAHCIVHSRYSAVTGTTFYFNVLMDIFIHNKMVAT